VGKDLLRPSHDALRDLFRRFEIVPRLRAWVRDLGRTLGTDIDRARGELRDWLGPSDERLSLPQGIQGLAVLRALGQWTLDYAHDGTDAGFPFDRPFLDLFQRCLDGCRAAEALLAKPQNDRRVHQALERLHRILQTVRSEVPFAAQVRTLERRARLFDELRRVLRLRDKQAPFPTEAQRQLEQLRDIREALEVFEVALRERRPERGPGQDMRSAIDLILRHLADHGPSLWGHAIVLPGGDIRVVERTNVILECFWHGIKHGERRRSGRKILTQDFEQLPAAAVLARNLLKEDYVAILCGSLDDLPRAFAALDASDRSRSLAARLRAAAEQRVATANHEIVSSSLPKADRDIVRTEAMRERILAAARSRAPWYPVRKPAQVAAGNRRLTP